MKMNFPFDSIKENFLYILGEKSHNSVDKNDLFIDYGDVLDDRFVKYLCLLQEQVNLLSIAKEKHDDLAMQSALFRIRTHAMSLSSFFDAIVEDSEIILRLETWPEIPEDNPGHPPF
ncbi:hypothetical protein [Aeromonas jandaei]|uniref:hypothetical protein n=1 Tax=Aeromonas jandaei TaxID=650 RepID=UPI001ADDA269|nr:hypothetical protein [Aeromonas jandaei]QTL92766.1 hypothetical protein AjGTCBM29_00601 [Aeromonas jandaei]